MSKRSRTFRGSGQLARTSSKRRLLIIGDAAAIVVAWIATARWADQPFGLRQVVVGVLLGVLATWIATQWDLHHRRADNIRTVEVAGLFRIAVIVGITGVVLTRAGGFVLPWPTALAACLASFVLLVGSHSVFDAWIRARRRSGALCRRVVLVGDQPAARNLLELLDDWPDLGYRVVGYIGPEPSSWEHGTVPEIGSYQSCAAAVVEADPDGIFVVGSAVSHPTVILTACQLADVGVHVQLAPGLGGVDHRRLRAMAVGYEPLIHLDRRTIGSASRLAKRLIDVAFSVVGLVLASPLLALAAIAIKLDDGGPIIFRQERVGRHGEVFRLFKLRTMVVDAHARRGDLAARNERTGPLFKINDDPRVTAVGRVLRATSIDELPQLVNVLRGEMSLVGPRPPLPEEFDQFDDELKARQLEAPGVTGLWQLEARDNPAFTTYRRLDLYYTRNWSVTLDLVIILLTAYSVVIRAASAVGRAGRRNVRALAQSGRGLRMVLAGMLCAAVAVIVVFVPALARGLTMSPYSLGVEAFGATPSAVGIPDSSDRDRTDNATADVPKPPSSSATSDDRAGHGPDRAGRASTEARGSSGARPERVPRSPRAGSAREVDRPSPLGASPRQRGAPALASEPATTAPASPTASAPSPSAAGAVAPAATAASVAAPHTTVPTTSEVGHPHPTNPSSSAPADDSVAPRDTTVAPVTTAQATTTTTPTTTPAATPPAPATATTGAITAASS